MSVYLLPTRTDRAYRGKYPNRIASVSFTRDARDVNDDVYVLIETNTGSRLTVAYDNLRSLATMPQLKQELSDVLRSHTVIHTMTRPIYDAWVEAEKQRRERTRSRNILDTLYGSN